MSNVHSAEPRVSQLTSAFLRVFICIANGANMQALVVIFNVPAFFLYFPNVAQSEKEKKAIFSIEDFWIQEASLNYYCI